MHVPTLVEIEMFKKMKLHTPWPLHGAEYGKFDKQLDDICSCILFFMLIDKCRSETCVY